MKTERILLRCARTSDAQVIFDTWAQDEKVTKYLAWKCHKTIDETDKYVARCIEDWAEGKSFLQLMESIETGQLTGAIHSRLTPHGVEFGYLVARKYWGNGLMSEVLTRMSNWWLQQKDVCRVSAHCHVDNIASAKVMENSGYHFEGVLRKHTLHPNVSKVPGDSKLYSRVK